MSLLNLFLHSGTTSLKVPEGYRQIKNYEQLLSVLNSDQNIGTILLNPLYANPGSLGVLKKIHELKPLSPVYLLKAAQPLIPEKDFYKLGIHGYRNLEDEVNSQPSFEGVQSTNMVTDPKFYAIRIQEIAHNQKLFLDVYARLETGRFIKVAQANDVLTLDRLESYVKKGVSHLYVSRQSVTALAHSVHTYANRLFGLKDVAVSLRLSHVLADCEGLLSEIQKTGLCEKHIGIAQEMIGRVFYLLDSIGPKEFIEALFVAGPLYDHVMMVTGLVAAVAPYVGVQSEKSKDDLGLSAFLHDVGLLYLPIDTDYQKRDRLSGEALELYLEHPALGAKILSGIHGISEVIVQAVAQHHERKDGKGFPASIHVEEINLFSQVVGCADAYVKLLSSQEMHSTAAYRTVLRDLFLKEVAPGFSDLVVLGFKKLLFNDGA